MKRIVDDWQICLTVSSSCAVENMSFENQSNLNFTLLFDIDFFIYILDDFSNWCLFV